MIDKIQETFAEFEKLNLASDPDLQAKLNIQSKTRSSLFPWRGQFSPQLVEHLLAEYSTKHTTVLDPFCGSGTVLAEAARCNISSIGYDINPGAYLFAAMHQLTRFSIFQREEMLLHAKRALSIQSGSEIFQQTECNPNYFSSVLDLQSSALLIGAVILMLAMGESKILHPQKLAYAIRSVTDVVRGMPHVYDIIDVAPLDCRVMPIQSESVDLVVTSPPYINVFNYHQNYRSALERLGWRPLNVAVAEIGSNRKHRQNRFLTVIQYAIDMELVLNEIGRVLRPNGRIILIVGRCSSVRGISFPNGTMLALIAHQNPNFVLESWQERHFTNRFGECIYEDVLVFCKTDRNYIKPETEFVGRHVGLWALRRGFDKASGDVRNNIEDAISIENRVHASPVTKVQVPFPFASIRDSLRETVSI